MGQSLASLHYHIIFSTKNRAQSITPLIRQRLYDYIGAIIKAEEGHLISAGGTDDHIHLLASLPPRVSVANVLRLIKTNSSKWIRETIADYGSFAWQTGYAAFSVSRSDIDSVRRYVDDQQQHHARTSFEDELAQILERHEIAYDPRYIWT